ncbi:MAG: choice-of-anchor L domain-containing protein [Flavobacteriales bacterium]|nr:choice-of-anchor L domain-containing protein [Flavobacteriales bacterium]
MSGTMQRIILRAAIVGGLGVFSGGLDAQLMVNPQTDLQALAQAIAGDGVRIANPVIDCHGSGYGEFTYSGSLLEVSGGVILTSGHIDNAIGPNTVTNRTFQQNYPGDPLLNTVTGRTTYDACRFEFDVIPGGDTLSFDFVFASEEYNEWVGSQFNDVFGFFISGPGISGDAGIGNDHNIALVPATTQAVTINNVNAGSNSAHYYFNAGGSQVQYDGITRDLRAMAHVQPCQTYHLKLIVADASDRKLDSGVLIDRLQSNAVNMTAFTANGMASMVEGCNSATLRFTRTNVTALPVDVPYFLAGTATNGSDYPLIGDSDPLVAKTATIPANAVSTDVIIDPLADGIIEGGELVKVYLGASACPNNYLDSLVIAIQDSLHVAVNVPSPICAGGNAPLNASGGLSYSWSPAAGLNNASIPGPVAAPAATTTYTVTATAGSCTGAASAFVQVSSIALNANITSPLCNGGNSGLINLTATGGLAPYAFVWNGPNGYTSNNEDIVNVAAGTYTVSVTDGAGCAHVQSFNVPQPQQLAIAFAPSILTFGQNIACFGATTGSLGLTITGGTAPYGIAWSGPNGFVSVQEDLSAIGAGTYSVLVTDAHGCATSGSFDMTQADALLSGIGNVQHVSCHGANDGSAEASVSGGMPPYLYSWNTTPEQNSALANGLAPGNHTVTITDGYGCTATQDVDIDEPDALTMTIGNVAHILNCQGQPQQDGSAIAITQGGTQPFALTWNTSPAQNAAMASFNSGGTYTATAIDANGCAASADAEILQPGGASISVIAQTNTICFDDPIGSATVEVLGGANVTSLIWNTVPMQSGATASGLSAGTYTATATHANGCTTSIDAIITGPTSPLQASIDPSIANVLCNGTDAGSATVFATGGGAPYSYSWNTVPEQTTPSAGGLGIGAWTAMVTDAFGCVAQATATIAGPGEPLNVVISSWTNVLCSGAAQGEATAQANGGTGPYTYLWNTPMQQTGATAFSLPEGTYSVTATDANGCTATTSVTILGPNLGIEAIVEDYGNVSCFGATDGFATILASGGSNSFSFLWNTVPPQTGPTATGLGAGTYLVAISDNNGCDSTKYLPVAISGPASPLAIDLDIAPILCGNVEDGAVDLTVSGGQFPYTQQWSDQWGNSTGLEDISGLSAGNYFLHVFDAFGCTVDTSFTLTAPDPILYQATVNAIPCQGSSTGSIDATVAGGTGAVDISWSGPNGFTASTASIANLDAGQYILNITDDNACLEVDTFTVIVGAPPALSAIATSHNGAAISCAGASDGAIDLTITAGTAPFAIAWTDGVGFNSSDEDIDSLAAGGYQVTVTDALGCTADTLVLLLPPAPVSLSATIASTNGNNIACAGGSTGAIDLSVSGGSAPYSYAWSNGTASEDISNATAGALSVLITDANGCTASGNWTLTEPAALEVAASSLLLTNGFGISCNGAADGVIDATITGGTTAYSVQWSGPNGYTSSDPSISGLVAGDYALAVTDANGCTASAAVLVNEPQAITVDLNATIYNGGVNVGCANGSNGAIQSDADGGMPGYSYSWNGPNGFTSTDAWINGLGAGNYDLTISDASGCVEQASITLNEPLPLEVNAILSDAGNGFNIGCAGGDGEIDLSITGGTPQYAIGWTGPNGFGSMLEDIGGLAAGTYQLEVMDANGCVSNESIVLLAPIPAQVDLAVTGTDCSGNANGVIDATVVAGEAPLSFMWNGPNGFNNTDEDLSGLENGDYTATITDAAGCVSMQTVSVNGPAPLVAGAFLSFYGQYNLQCMGDSTGVIEIDPQGGYGPFSALVSGPGGYSSTALDHTSLIAGDYQITITDAFGCALDTVVTLVEPSTTIDATLNVSLYPSGTNVSCFGSTDGWIDASINGGIGPFTFLWRGPDSTEYSTEDITGLPAGSYAYELVVTDANQCSFFTDVVLTQPAEPLSSSFVLSDFGGSNVSCSGSSDGAIDPTVSGGSPSYTYAWSGPSGFASSSTAISGLIVGTYSLTVTDTNGCVLSTPVELIAPLPIDAQLVAPAFPGGTSISCFGATDGTIDATIIGGTPGYALAWSGPNGFTSDQAQLSALAAGPYCLSVTDANGCSAQECITLSEPQALAATNSAQLASCGNNNGAIDLSVVGGSLPYQYAWSTGAATEDLSGIAPGTYNVLVTDANGCTAISTATVTGTPGVDGTAMTQDNLCHGGNEGAIDVSVLSGTAPYSYQWNDGSTDEDRSAIGAGTYTLLVTDANGCTWNDTWDITESSAIEIDSTVSVYNGGFNVSHYGGSNGSIEIAISGGAPPYAIAWSNGATGNSIDNLSAGEYTVTIADANGCTTVRTIIITQPQDLDMPTGYTPNGDGYNDFFVIHGLEAYPSNTLTVFNRWGSKVYDRLNYTNDWHGENSHGEALPNGTYFVILTIEGGGRTLQGYVDLRR